MITFFKPLYSLNALFPEANPSCQIFQWMAISEIKIFMEFSLVFANNTISSRFCLSVLVTNLYFVVYSVIAQILNPTAEFTVPIGVPTKEEKTEIETHPVIADTKITINLLKRGTTINDLKRPTTSKKRHETTTTSTKQPETTTIS